MTYDLQLHGLAIELDSADFLVKGLARALRAWGQEIISYEVDTNGGDVGLGVGVIGETQQQARLSDTRVSDEE